MKRRIQDSEYVKYIKSLPCCICGWIPKGYFYRYNEQTDKKERIKRTNALAHIGDGIHTTKYSVYWSVPACDKHCDPRAPNCHKDVIDANSRLWHPALRRIAQWHHGIYRARKARQLPNR